MITEKKVLSLKVFEEKSGGKKNLPHVVKFGKYCYNRVGREVAFSYHKIAINSSYCIKLNSFSLHLTKTNVFG